MDFRQAKTYDDLLEANQRFIKGELRKSPYHHGPLSEITISSNSPSNFYSYSY